MQSLNCQQITGRISKLGGLLSDLQKFRQEKLVDAGLSAKAFIITEFQRFMRELLPGNLPMFVDYSINYKTLLEQNGFDESTAESIPLLSIMIEETTKSRENKLLHAILIPLDEDKESELISLELESKDLRPGTPFELITLTSQYRAMIRHKRINALDTKGPEHKRFVIYANFGKPVLAVRLGSPNYDRLSANYILAFPKWEK